jgi:hypothetical protein
MMSWLTLFFHISWKSTWNLIYVLRVCFGKVMPSDHFQKYFLINIKIIILDYLLFIFDISILKLLKINLTKIINFLHY